MAYQQSKYRLFSGFAAVILILAGCASQIQKPARICPGKETVTELLSVLRSRSKNTVPLKASGQCVLRYRTENNKPKKESFPVKLWVNPPVETYMQGDIAFDPKGIVLGSNEDEFWLAMKAKEIRSYWWGRWSKEICPEKLMISPRLILEALGIVAVGDAESWSLSNEETFDVLTKQQDGAKTSKIYIDNCDYLVRRIEYFDDYGQVTIITELGKYKELIKGFLVPSSIRIINYRNGAAKNSVQITLGSIKSTSFTDEQKRYLFARPRPEGFKHIYKIIDGDIVEQPQ